VSTIAAHRSYSTSGIGLSGFATLARLADTTLEPTLLGTDTGGDRMRAKFSGWKHLLYTAAALATLALAAGARFKPN
jgi:hypothetical protein